jgi:soluble lytic murein transglycosylase
MRILKLFPCALSADQSLRNQLSANNVALLGLYLLLMTLPNFAGADPDRLQWQRKQFLAAEEALENRHFATYRNIVRQLDDYPLKPYLEYSELHRRLYLFPYDEVDQFLRAHTDTHIGALLTREWLETLARQRRWQDYRTYFDDHNIQSAELRCYALRARFNTGDEAALEAVAELWNVGHSQPDACDPLFNVWMDRGFLSDDIAWQRYAKAIGERNLTLARYLARQMSPELKTLADLYYDVARHPERLENHERFSLQTPHMHEIILHGIRRYAQRDPLKALLHWERYDARHYFPTAERHRTQEYLIIQLAVEGHMAAVRRLLQQTEQITSMDLIAWLVRDALRSEDWQRAYDAIQLFPAEEQQSERWLYWRARALERLNISDPLYSSARQIYARLALTRGFYGFLSADVLGHDYTLVDRPVNPPGEAMEAIRNSAGMRRAKELLDLGRVVQARREWFYATRGLAPAQLLAAGKLAEQWGWYRKSIQAMIEARHWDDLQLRFPLAYPEEIRSASASTNIDPPFLYAIARQESAFAADAKSPAGAMGVMQLMPSTARSTAREIGVQYRYWDLIDPSQNIQLGSRYLHQLLDQFNGNRILAAAAYNAGPYRVKQWLENSEKQLPYDIWIETIPYGETRSYVQNVLAYSVIYGYRMGKQIPMFRDKENGDIKLVSSEAK